VKYFVTGATGFIGGYVVRQLIAAGHQVTSIVRNPSKALDLAKLGVAVQQGDITDKESMRLPMTGVDGVFHIAGWYKLGSREKSQATPMNVGGTRNVLELMRELGIRKGVYTSSIAIFSDTQGKMVDETYRHNGPWLSEYDYSKWQAHYEIAEPMMKAGLPLVIVQPGSVYGPGDTGPIHSTLVQYLQRRLVASPQHAEYCWAHVDDIARGHLLAMDKGRIGESYIIAGERKLFTEVMKLAEQITGIPAPIIQFPPWLMKLAAMMMKPIGAVVPLPTMYTSEFLRQTAGTTYIGTNAKAKREWGYTVRSLEAGLRETLAYEMQQLGIKPR
jgi:nucleoside-diphosphate-sugar epimerase